MKKPLKITLWIAGIIVVVLALMAGGFYLKMKSEMRKMYINETRQVTHGAFIIKDSFVNMFVLKDSDNYIAIDAGNDPKMIRNELKKLSIDTAKVVAVLLTHSDGDHTGALSMFKNATVYLSNAEEQMINGTTARRLGSHNSISRKNYKLLNDGQILTVGSLKIKCILTPGHTPGSMSYVVNDSLLYVGDAFSLTKGKITKPNPVFTQDMETALKSFDKIAKLPTVTHIFTAHTGYSCEYKYAVDTKLTEK